ncbi:MAG: FHA domain-containing protein [Deltaproteobacteria bacterium]|nr:FHA domain-containing protein [Deltaproteobacteria bacterium]
MSRPLIAIGLVVLVAWLVAVPLGLARAVLGREPLPSEVAIGWLPGVALAMICFVVAAWPRLVAAAGTWRPGTAVEGLERGPERIRAARARREPRPKESAPTSIGGLAAPVAPAPVPPPLATRAAALPIVHLGPRADPAWAAWSFRWEAPGHGHGVVVLPFGRHVLVGRAPAADVVIRLDQVSWEHLELDVREGEVTLLDLESSNGTRSGDGAIAARRPWAWAPRTAIHLAHPTAVSLTLEPLR